MDSFDRHAETYDAHAEVQALAARRLADWITPEARKGPAVELGAGTGLLTRLLQPWLGVFWATDAAANMVLQGRRNAPAAVWEKMDARAARISPDTAWIFSSSMLQWLDDPLSVLADWRRQAPRARLGISVFAQGTLAELEAVFPGHAPLEWRTDAQWLDILKSAGWKVSRHEGETSVSYYRSPMDLLHTLRNFGGTGTRARANPARLRTALAQYRRQSDAQDARYPASWRVFRALAEA